MESKDTSFANGVKEKKEKWTPENVEDCKVHRNIAFLVENREVDGKNFRTAHKGLRKLSISEDPDIIRIHKRIKMGSTISDVIKSNISFVSRFKIFKELKKHTGCVNTIQWNQDGSLLVTGSDDCTLNIWSFANHYKLQATLETGHFRNIFSAKFVPYSDNKQIISGGMDGEVRFHDLSKSSPSHVLLSSFQQMVYKLFFLPSSASTFLSTHQDGCVRLFDLRKRNENEVLLKMKPAHYRSSGSVNSLAFNPMAIHQFILGGADPFLHLYDMRYLQSGTDSACVAKFCPPSLFQNSEASNDRSTSYITGVDFNSHNEVVCTYSKEDVYLFDINAAKDSNRVCINPKQVYTGRRNMQTFLKEVTFFGDDSFVATGSDCGHLFIWEKNSGKLVQLLKGDKRVVNGVASHPYLPILATCGIDSSGKIFECTDEPTFVQSYANKIQAKNRTIPEEDDEEAPIRLSLNQFLELIRSVRAETTSRDQEEEEQPQSFSQEWLYNQEINEADALRMKANKAFQEDQFEQALIGYDEALEHLEFEVEEVEGWDSSETISKRNNAKVLCILNKAAAYIKLSKYEEAVEECRLALEIQPHSLKAYFRRGTAYLGLKKYQEAKADLQKAAELAPGDNNIKKMLQEIEEKMKKQEN